ncbi:hypothetical protein L228DRAFT_246345 [Xylona heveae TC161]|uniref:Uncharacterized protein n=1 Tax=Xylona heveae (strain CBS 132557 / TC161) TaxID=1328760 RepID=A0A165HI87_XYLHT|nr:hypothetical protein L228DRAFT_246345 [Xylona heveae TC161]KZF23559.1 hypothetical protein L228DRAFT_246345 [Xylona heveae TC161]
MGLSRAEGRGVQSLNDEDLRRLDLDPRNIEYLRKELQELAGDKAWRLEVIDLADGVRRIRGVLDVNEADEEYDGEYNSEEYPGRNGDQEREGAE